MSSETATGSSIELAVETEAEATPAGREPFAESILLQSSDGDMKLEALGEAGSASFYAALLIPFERFHRARRRHFVLGILLGTVASLAVGICGFQSVRAGRHSVDVRTTAPPTAPTNAPAQVEISSAASTPIAPQRALNVSRERSVQAAEPYRNPIHSAAPISALNAPRTHEILTPVPSPTIRPRSEKASVMKKNATPEQLWASVEAGSVSAALTLADRYARGDGVPVNCDQARVLLKIASDKGSAEAGRKLQELETDGSAGP